MADTSRALERFKTFVPRPRVADGEPELPGLTVGNSPDGSPFGEVSSPLGIGGSSPGGIVSAGNVGVGDAVGDGVLAAMTLMVAAEWKELAALLPRAVAVSVIRSPAEAARRTKVPATSSSLCPVGKVPTVQTAPFGLGHTVKRGAPTCATFPRAAVTVTP